MKIINATNSNAPILVDDEDFDLISENNWQVNPETGIVQRCERVFGAPKTILMCRVIMNAPLSVKIDHRNHNTLDNQKQNLREATRTQNGQNRLKQASATLSKFKGVSFFGGKWTAQIRVNRKKVHIGRFSDETEAALAYDSACRTHFGEFAYTNFNNQEALSI